MSTVNRGGLKLTARHTFLTNANYELHLQKEADEI